MRTCRMYGPSFSDTISLKVSCAINLVASVANLTPQVLMQTYIPRVDLTTVLYPAAPEVKVAKVSKGRTR